MAGVSNFGFCLGGPARCSTSLADACFVNAPGNIIATSRPSADVAAFICSESRVYGVVPGNGSQQNATAGSLSSGSRHAHTFTSMYVLSAICLMTLYSFELMVDPYLESFMIAIKVSIILESTSYDIISFCIYCITVY